MSENNNSFSYTYSAKDQAEIKQIRMKYAPREEDKLMQLRRLDARVSQTAVMYSIIFGVISALILGVGMCCCMVWGGWLFVPGIILGLIGIAGVSLAYPVYNQTLKKEREKIAPQVLRLTDELMK